MKLVNLNLNSAARVCSIGSASLGFEGHILLGSNLDSLKKLDFSTTKNGSFYLNYCNNEKTQELFCSVR